MSHTVSPATVSPAGIRRRPGRRLGAVVMAVALLSIGATACSDDPATDTAASAATEAGAGTPAAGPEAAAAALEVKRTVIDVRAPEEYAAGHVEGAERIGLADADFTARIADLDPDGSYVVYCRSGNRSAQAATEMRAAGLDAVDGGAMDDMIAAGWPAA